MLQKGTQEVPFAVPGATLKEGLSVASPVRLFPVTLDRRLILPESSAVNITGPPGLSF